MHGGILEKDFLQDVIDSSLRKSVDVFRNWVNFRNGESIKLWVRMFISLKAKCDKLELEEFSVGSEGRKLWKSRFSSCVFFFSRSCS